MYNLFLIDGIPGSGKRELIRYCSNALKTVFHKKYTTKEKDTDGFYREDLIYVDEDKFQKQEKPDDFIYTYPRYDKMSAKYLISKSELDQKLKEYGNVFVIVRSTDVIRDIKKRYSQYLNVNVVSIFTYCDNEKLKTRTYDQLREANPEIDEAKLNANLSMRVNRNVECLESYINTLHDNQIPYDYVIINDLNTKAYYTCIDKIVNKYVRNSNNYNDLSAFVIMPMPDNREAAHFYNVKEAIYAGAQKAGFTALRADDVSDTPKPIFNQIKENIDKATVCIVDLTNSRPNCYFEAGLAYNRNPYDFPTTFFIAEQGSKIEFDLQGIRREEYTYRFNDYSNIEKTVERILNKFKKEHIF